MGLCPGAGFPKAANLTRSCLSAMKYPAAISNFAITKSFLTQSSTQVAEGLLGNNSKLSQYFKTIAIFQSVCQNGEKIRDLRYSSLMSTRTPKLQASSLFASNQTGPLLPS